MEARSCTTVASGPEPNAGRLRDARRTRPARHLRRPHHRRRRLGHHARAGPRPVRAARQPQGPPSGADRRRRLAGRGDVLPARPAQAQHQRLTCWPPRCTSPRARTSTACSRAGWGPCSARTRSSPKPAPGLQAPRGVALFWNAGNIPVGILEMISLGGLEECFCALSGPGGEYDPETLPSLAARYGCEVDFEGTIRSSTAAAWLSSRRRRACRRANARGAQDAVRGRVRPPRLLLWSTPGGVRPRVWGKDQPANRVADIAHADGLSKTAIACGWGVASDGDGWRERDLERPWCCR